jgi:hypothetical protein
MSFEIDGSAAILAAGVPARCRRYNSNETTHY